MDDKSILNELLDVAERLGIEVRHEYLGGEGGGLCRLRGKQVLFVDVSASQAEQLARTATALAGLDQVDEQYVVPKVRQVLDRYREEPKEAD